MSKRYSVTYRVLAALLLLAGCEAGAQVSVLTHHNDNGRTGQNLQETTLNTSNVNVSNFGLLFSRAVDGFIYAQPLYVPSLNIAGKIRNVVYVATEHNSVYAFDADDPQASSPLWQVNLGTPVPSNDICNPPLGGCPYTDLEPEIGITATPVIDPSSNTIYVVAKTKNTSNNSYHFFLHALDLLSGAEKFGGPKEITAPGFTPFYENNRPGLLLLNGVVYAGFGSVGDYYTWHGFVMGYNDSTLAQVAVYNDTPGSGAVGGGIWGGDQGLAADADNVYATTSNGTFDVNTGGSDYSSSILKLSTSTGLKVADYFAPDNQSFLNGNNADLGAGGPLLLPGTTLLVAGGKDGFLRVVDTSNMGKFNPTFNANLQNFQATNPYPNGMIMGSPIYWDSPNYGPLLYLWGPSDVIKAWKLVGQTFQTTPVMQGTTPSPAGISNEAAMSLSANGSQVGTGIVWAAGPVSGDANTQAQPGALHAYDASDLSHELWNSNQDPARDNLGNYAKFSPPTIANGKVYIGTFSDALMVYGLNPPPASAIKYIQVAAATPQSSVSTASVSLTSPQIAGDLNVVVVGWNDTSSSVQSVKDSNGNTYALATGPIRGNALSQSIYYAKNIAAGSNTVTITFNQAASYPDVRVLEYAGADPNTPLDVAVGSSGSGTAASSGSASTTAANELLVGANTVFTGNKAAGTGFTLRIITSPDADLAEDRIAATAGTYSATATLGSKGAWVMQMAAFKPATSLGTPAPTVTAVSPNSGPATGGTAVTVSGTNFASGASVSFGGNTASNVTVSSSTSLTATTPAHAAGTVNVVVTNSDGQSGTLNSGFTYISSTPPPSVASVNPTSGPATGGTSVTISGSNFVSGATVDFGGNAASSVTVSSSTSITATTPAHAAGTVNVVVTNPDGQSGTLTNGFTYNSTVSTIRFVQVAFATPQSSSVSVSATYPAAQTSGNLNVVVVGWNDSTSQITSVTDNLGNTYSLAVGPTTGTNLRQAIYYAANIKGGANAVKVTFNQAAVFVDLRILEYSGVATTSPLDATSAATGSSSNATSGSATTHFASELIFGANTVYTGDKGPGTGFTSRVITSPDGDIAEDMLVTATGTSAATAPLVSSGNWVMQMATFKAAGQ